MRYVTDLAVSGSIEWDRFTGAISANVRFSGAASGRVTVDWNDYDRLAQASLSGRVDGEVVNLALPAP